MDHFLAILQYSIGAEPLDLITISRFFRDNYVELHSEERLRLKAKKGASKTKYSCPQCGTNAWAKPKTRLICGDCVILLVAETQDEEDE